MGWAQIQSVARTAQQGGFPQLTDMTAALSQALQQAQAAVQQNSALPGIPSLQWVVQTCAPHAALADAVQDWAYSLSKHLQLGEPHQQRLLEAALKLQARGDQHAVPLTAQPGSRAAKAGGSGFAGTPARIHFDDSSDSSAQSH